MMDQNSYCFLIIWIVCSFSHSGAGPTMVAVDRAEATTKAGLGQGKLRDKIFNGPCDLNKFRCKNDVCIDKPLYCNGVNNCGDNSDEAYCRVSTCSDDSFFKCAYSYRCIPAVWRCDGKTDCPRSSNNNHEYKEDETNCDKTDIPIVTANLARQKVLRWLNSTRQNRTSNDKWGPHVHKIAVAQFLGNPYAPINNEIAYEVSLRLLSRFTLKKMNEVSTTDFSPYINALLVTCINPRKFYSMDLVEELRSRVNRQSYPSPYDLLTLCNAGDKLTEKDVENLKNAISYPQREIWTDIQAIAVLALVCAGRRPESSFSLDSLSSLTDVLKKKQYENGRVENVKTTALVLQALFASQIEEDETTFDEEKAFQQILQEQRDDGSFGTLEDTYVILPVLFYKSLVNISSDHCPPKIKDEETALDDLLNRPGPKIQVMYSLWIGNQKDIERTLRIRVPTNSTFFEVMEMASDVDSKYRFQYVMKNTKPYITAISGYSDDPETLRFWFPYIFNKAKPEAMTQSVADVVLKENDHIAMWYHGSWTK